MITKEMLEEKLADLRSQKEQSIANLNAIQGAILFCEKLLNELLKIEFSKMKE